MQSILIIDDDQTIGNLEQEVLEREGYAVLRAYSGTEAQIMQTAHLFERFYTVNTARSGTGLGLPIAKLLTEKMGGNVAAEYNGGKLRICICFAEQ